MLAQEVLPARTRWLTPLTAGLLAFLTGCALGFAGDPVRIPQPEPPTEGVGLSVWTLPSFDTMCEASWLRPAFECRSTANYAPVFLDACNWTCPSAYRM